MTGMLPRVCDDSACPIYTKAGEHLVDLLRAGVVHVFRHALREDPGADNRPVAATAAGNSLHIPAVGPVDLVFRITHVSLYPANIAQNGGRRGGRYRSALSHPALSQPALAPPHHSRDTAPGTDRSRPW